MEIADKLEEWKAANPDAAESYKGIKPPEAVLDRLKDVYGEAYHEDLDSRSTEQVVELATNLSAGVPMGTPVFDGAREPDVSDMSVPSAIPCRNWQRDWEAL